MGFIDRWLWVQASEESCFLGLSYFCPPLHCLPRPRPQRHTQRKTNPDLVAEALGGLVAADLAE